MHTLEILIPTYGRPDSAAAAMGSCLAVDDPRIAVRCNSNGFEADLERFRQADPRLNYDCFERNRGVHANFYQLLSHAGGRFCMLLSDEDRLDPAAIGPFLDYLDRLPETVQVVSCAIFNTVTERYYRRHGWISQEQDMTLDDQLPLQLIPTYMSGLVFSSRGLAGLDLKDCLQPTIGNSYAHLDIAALLLTHGTLRVYNQKLVLKGADRQTGGDGYAHRSGEQSGVSGNLDLNPRVYGPRARARQYYYRDRLICRLRSQLKPLRYQLARLNHLVEYARMVINSPRVVILPPETRIADEVRAAAEEARAAEESVRSGITSLFALLLVQPRLVRSLLLAGLRVVSQLGNKVMKRKIRARG